jgi:hypothetical protein
VPSASEYYTQRLDTLNNGYDKLIESLSQRLRTAIEVNGAKNLVSV